jgi:hypothetical protein
MQLAAALLLLAGGVARAQAPDAAPPGDTQATAGAGLSFHAFINQAYARSDSHQIVGITKSGTTDYRTVALQVRYRFGPSDDIVTQLTEHRLGASVINSVDGDIELELAFYEHRFADSTTIRLGKMQLPVGIYNEIRNVGTLLPFFAPPGNVYDEQFTNRELEGAMVSHSFAPLGGWSVDADLYGGGWSETEEIPSTQTAIVARAENAIGTQLWLMTPISGVRFGIAAYRYDAKGRLIQVNATDRLQNVTLSFDGTFSGFFVRAEYLHEVSPVRLSAVLVAPHLVYTAYYGQVGVDLTKRLSLNLQADLSRFDLGLGGPAVVNNDDYAVGLAFKFRSNVVAKIEGHKNRGQLAEGAPSGLTHTTYGLLSCAASF